MQNQLGIPTQMLEREALMAMEPAIGPLSGGALYCPGDGVAHHGAITQAFADAALACGAEITTGQRVVSLVVRGSQVMAATFIGR